jgi:hypothetical protein
MIAANGFHGNFLPDALRYGQLLRSWIIPIRNEGPKNKPPPGCKWKHLQRQEPEEATQRQFFHRDDLTGLAVAPRNGLAIRDFDRRTAYLAWAAANPGDAARLPTSATHRGYHVFALLDRELWKKLADGELIANPLHYALLPPSVHPLGSVYHWLIPLPAEGPLPRLPDSVLQPWADTTAESLEESQDSQPPQLSCATCTISDAISRTLPTGPGLRHFSIFDLVREVKAIRPDATVDELREICWQWYGKAAPLTSGTHDFGTYWADFISGWRECKRPAGASFREAVARADASDPPERWVKELHCDGVRLRLALLCRELQRLRPGEPFYLSHGKAGAFLGLSSKQAGRLLYSLCADRLLVLVKNGQVGKGPTGQASLWKFISTD